MNINIKSIKFMNKEDIYEKIKDKDFDDLMKMIDVEPNIDLVDLAIKHSDITKNSECNIAIILLLDIITSNPELSLLFTKYASRFLADFIIEKRMKAKEGSDESSN